MERTSSPAVLEPMANHWLNLDLMGTLKLYRMRRAYDVAMAGGIKRQHESLRIVGNLVQSEIVESEPSQRHRSEPDGERHARSATCSPSSSCL